jgi:uncharacterized membrane protein YczE
MTRRLVQLFFGLFLYGLSTALMLRAGLGLNPWDVFHQGLAARSGWSIGTVIIAVGAFVLLLWIPLRQRPGFGTLANLVCVGLAANLSLAVLPAVQGLALQAGFLLAGVVLNGIATGAYIGAGLGPGPRDGLMTGLVRRSGWQVRTVRTGIELGVVAAGWLLGGTVGVGTLLYALAIGPLVQIFLPLFSRGGAAAAPASGDSLQDGPP